MLFFRKRAEDAPTNEKKAARSMPRTKKVQFLPVDIRAVIASLDESLDNLAKYEPVNYYASKEKFLQCTFFYKEDYSEVYFVVEYYESDSPRSSTPYYKADYELMKKVVMKFGQRI